MQETASYRSSAVYGLAAVGFAALVAAGMWLALYSARYVPAAVSRVGSAAVAVSAFFSGGSPDGDGGLVIVPPSASSTPSGAASSTPAATTTPAAPQKPVPVAPAPGPHTSGAYPIGTTTPVAPSGPADLVIGVDAVGYLASTTAESFVASSTVPAGGRPAVVFTIRNVGGAATGPWRFSASIPTQTFYIYQSQPQQSLNPGDSIEYTLGFDEANAGANQTISVTANFDKAVSESNYENDSASIGVTILGS